MGKRTPFLISSSSLVNQSTILLFLFGCLSLLIQINMVHSEDETIGHEIVDNGPDESDFLDDDLNLVGTWGNLELAEKQSDLDINDPEMSLIKRHMGSIVANSKMRFQYFPGTNTIVPVLAGGYKRAVPPTLRRFFYGRRPLPFPSSETSRTKKMETTNSEEDEEDELPVVLLEHPLGLVSRGKRFMGSLARGGWFPRQFRGYVGSNPMQSGGTQWDKRHVGAFARLGWMPHGRLSRRPAPFFNDFSSDKRNLGSFRKSQFGKGITIN